MHLPGLAYGAEPAVHGLPADSSRYSYTEYEFLYAQARPLKTWVILPALREYTLPFILRVNEPSSFQMYSFGLYKEKGEERNPDKTSETQTIPEVGKRGRCNEANAALNSYCASDSSIPPIPRTASVNFTMSNGSGKS